MDAANHALDKDAAPDGRPVGAAVEGTAVVGVAVVGTALLGLNVGAPLGLGLGEAVVSAHSSRLS